MSQFSAFVLINVEAGKAFSARDKIAESPHTRFAYCVTGAFDIIARIDAASFDELVRETVIEEIHKIRGVTGTVTCLVVSEKHEPQE